MLGGSIAREALRGCGLFGNADEPTLDALAAALRVRRFREAETIFHQGDPGDSLFILETARSRSFCRPPRARRGRSSPPSVAGDFFGELALLDGAPHSATSSPSSRRRRSSSAAPRSSPWSTGAGPAPGPRRPRRTELRRLTGHVEELHFLDLPGRLAGASSGSPASATRPRRRIRIAWPYTQSDLAGMIGGTRQTVNRLINDLVERGLVRFEKDDLVIPDLERLERAAER